MRLRSKVFAVLILFLFFTTSMSIISKNQDLSGKDINYIPHDPIEINGNNGFTKTHGVSSGNGTKDNPYIIRGWDINCSFQPGIVISNVNIYFVIQDCYIHNGGDDNDGVVFCKVQFGRIQNNTISKNRNGIKFASKSSGIGLENSDDNIITDNRLIFNSGCGICFEHIGKDHHSGNMILNNDFEYNFIGIYMIMSDSNQIISNNFIFNYESGLILDQCMGGGQYNKMYHNNFIDNGEVRQVFDRGVVNYWNDSYPSGGNYWYDYMGCDSFSGSNQSMIGSDGIGDSPYVIRSNSSWLPERLDSYPLMKPIGIINRPLIPAKPKITGTKFGKEKSIIKFNISSIDPNNDSVYYSINWGDGYIEKWFGPYNSGEVVTVNHSWNNQGNYEIIVKVWDKSYEEQDNNNLNNYSILIFPGSAICKPLNGLYVSNEKIFDLPILKNKSIAIGNIDIIVDVLNEELNIERVEYYIDDVLKNTDYKEPFVWNWAETDFSRFNVTTILYSNNGFNASYKISVWKFF